jgi:hypothetical protein
MIDEALYNSSINNNEIINKAWTGSILKPE